MKTLETERLLLRKLRIDDMDDFHEYSKNPDVTSMLNWKPLVSKESACAFLKSFTENSDVLAIVLKDSKKVIGHIKISPDENRGKYSERNSAKLISYALSEDYSGKGYMTEALKTVIKYIFEEMNAELLTAFHFPHNIRSKRVLEKCGFIYETTIVQGYKCHDGQIFDSVCHLITKSDYYK